MSAAKGRPALVSGHLRKAERSGRLSRDGFGIHWIRWVILADKARKDADCPYDEVVIDLTEAYNNFGWRFETPRGHQPTLTSIAWAAATDDWREFDRHRILESVEAEQLKRILTGKAVVTFEIGRREGGPGDRVDRLGRFIVRIAFSEAEDAERWRGIRPSLAE